MRIVSCPAFIVHPRLHRLVGDSHLGKKMNKMLAHIDRWMLEAILLALRAACGGVLPLARVEGWYGVASIRTRGAACEHAWSTGCVSARPVLPCRPYCV